MDHPVLQTDRHRYVVVSHLAEGGMGAIYLGRRMGAEGRSAEVVLKQLLPEHTADPKLIELFLREARLSAHLDHANIVHTLDLVNAGEDYFIVMEYVAGGDLRTLLKRARRRQARLSIDSVLFIVSEVLAALSYAHERRDRDGRALGLIHRDVSPSNILVGGDGTVKLTDFGIAKAPTQGSVVYKVKGKIGYMAPEQARGEPVDRRVDLFAVGIVLYEALVGERLFLGNHLTSAAVLFSQPVRPPSKSRPEVSAELDAIVLRALSLDRDGRYATADEFHAAILSLAQRNRRLLSKAALAADLRVACGEDPALWRSLDVPDAATLDAGPSEGTGVIFTDEDAFDYDRPSTSTGTRTALPPMKELLSVAVVTDPDSDQLETRVELDPFSESGLAEPSPPRGREMFGDDDGAQTRVVAPAPAPREKEAARPREPERARKPAPPSVAAKPSIKDKPAAPRVVLHAPVPRGAMPPPDSNAPRAPVAPPPVSTSPTMLAGPSLVSRPLPATKSLPSSPASSPTRGGRLTAPADVPAASLSSLERSLAPRPASKIVFAVVLLLVLAALGIGVGVLLSGSNAGLPSAPR